MKTKNICLVILLVVLLSVLGWIVWGYYQKTIEVIKNPVVVMEVENYGAVTIELYPDKAPNTVANFIKLVNSGYYNGAMFHRVIADGLVQGGKKDDDNSAEEEFTIPGEFMANGFEQNNLRHEAGTLSMARADYSSLSQTLLDEGYNSGSTQFFITVNNSRQYDGLYCGFGRVTSGLDIVTNMSNAQRGIDEDGNETEEPVEPIVISRMAVETYGIDYGEPERLEPFDYYTWLMNQYQTMSY